MLGLKTKPDHEARIEHLKRAVNTLTEQRDAHAKTIEELRLKITVLETTGGDECPICDGECEDCEMREDELSEWLRELVAIYERIAEKPAEARERLAAVLSQMDSAWRAG